MQPLDGIPLERGVLRTQSKDIGTGGIKFCVMVAKSTGFGRAPSCARNLLSPLEELRLIRHAGARIGINHRPSGERRQLYRAARRRREDNIRHCAPRQMPGCAIVVRNGQIVWKLEEVLVHCVA